MITLFIYKTMFYAASLMEKYEHWTTIGAPESILNWVKKCVPLLFESETSDTK